MGLELGVRSVGCPLLSLQALELSLSRLQLVLQAMHRLHQTQVLQKPGVGGQLLLGTLTLISSLSTMAASEAYYVSICVLRS